MLEIDKRSHLWIPEPNSGCYLWLGKLGPRPQIRVGGRKGKHRLAVNVFCEEVKGPCPDGLEHSHTCSNGLCVNPDHVVYETRSENEMRKPAKVRKMSALIALHVRNR
jgi:hypothetical protein